MAALLETLLGARLWELLPGKEKHNIATFVAQWYLAWGGTFRADPPDI
jgi:hypothetical protein